MGGFPEEHAHAETEAQAEDAGWNEATGRGCALVVQVMLGRYASERVFSLTPDGAVNDGEALMRSHFVAGGALPWLGLYAVTMAPNSPSIT